MNIQLVLIKIFKYFLILILFVVFDFSLNFTLYNPQFITPIYDFFLQHHVLSPETGGYLLPTCMQRCSPHTG